MPKGEYVGHGVMLSLMSTRDEYSYIPVAIDICNNIKSDEADG